MTDGGFTVVKPDVKHDTTLGRGTYSDSVKKHTRVFVNSSRHKTNDVTLKTVKHAPNAYNNRNNGNRRHTRDCTVFISRLDPGTTVQNVSQYLKSKYKEHMRVEQMQTKYDSYASFKVHAPHAMKRDLLNRYNWDDDGDVFVREFIERSRTPY